jgi:hypothetical protein
MVDEYGAVVEWLIMGESRRKLEENLLPVSFTANVE